MSPAEAEAVIARTAELFTRAADAAGKAAAEASQGERVIRIEGGADPTGEGWSQISVDFGPQRDGRRCGAMLGDTEDGELAEPDARLIAASGPDHWRTVEALLRAGLALHPHTTGDAGVLVCATCVNLGEPDTWPCATLAALRPLAEQAQRDLEGTA